MADDINLTDRTPAPGLRAVRDRRCSHQRMSVNANARRLTCDGCGAELDPYKALATIAHNSEKVRQWSDAATLAAKRLNEIERLDRNARARLKNLGEEAPAKKEIEEELCGELSAWIEEGAVCVWMWKGAQRAVRRFTVDEAEAAAQKLAQLAWRLRKTKEA